MEVEQIRTQSEKWLEEFLDRTQPPLIDNKISVNLDHLRAQNPKCVQSIIQSPVLFHKLIKDWNKARTQIGDGKKVRTGVKEPPVRISFQGNLGTNFVTPRGLGSKMANQLVGIQGIVTKCSVSRFQLNRSVHWCAKTSQTSIKEYIDEFAPDQEYNLKKNKTIPISDMNNNPLDFEFGRSTFKNFQTAVIQELPEMAPPGQLPRSVNVVLQDDLVDKIKPGDRVQMLGVYKLQPGLKAVEAGIIKTLLICTSVVSLAQQLNPFSSSKLSLKLPYPEDKILEFFSQSISPSVYGHQQLKKAVLLMMLGGCEKVLDNGAHLRGDINLLMIGDPGTAKSQMLRWVLSSVQIGVNTTGSGASGVGLTAAVTMDKDTGQRNIEAGAMVLADRGFVCIDEFDKMDERDRVAVHEVMEQQTVTIAKAGIHVSLNARCSVIAAANPIYGQYQKDLTPTKNIGMPDSLLSRFDLIFIILDQRDAETDRRIAERVCKNHRYATIQHILDNNVEEDFIIQPAEATSSKEEMMFEKSALFKSNTKVQILTQGYLRRYVSYCRKNVFPTLTDQSVELLSILWSCLRQKDLSQKEIGAKVLPITIRSYQTLIRLSSAHAKLRLSSQVQSSDCVEAFKLMVFSIYKDQYALDKELAQAISIVSEAYPLERQKGSANRNKGSVKTQSLKRKEKSENKTSKAASLKKEIIKRQQSEVIRRIHKIKINQEEDQIQRAVQGGNVRDRKKTNSQVFTVFSKMIANKKDERVTFQQLLEEMEGMDEGQLKQSLRDLDQNQKLLFDEEKGNVHSV